MDKPIFSYAVISDVHLGHINTPTDHIVANLYRYFLTEENKTLDAIFIAGDLFDRLLDFNSTSVHSCVQFIHRLLNYCKEHQIKLRVLEGTATHDWHQSEIILKINESAGYHVDLKYFSALDIEIIEDFGLSVLYIPDDYITSQEMLDKLLSSRLQQLNLEKVDLAILHGQFKYQIEGRPIHAFSYDEYYMLDKVKRFINIGHFHVYSRYDRIIAQGSFDRLAHGEEGSKGYVIQKLYKEQYKDESIFIENKDAYLYITLHVRKNTTFEQLDKRIASIPEQSYLRFVIARSSPLYGEYHTLKTRYSSYNVRFKVENDDEVKQTMSLNEDIIIEEIGINQHNFKEKLIERILLMTNKEDVEFVEKYIEAL